MNEPDFWYKKGIISSLLVPIEIVYSTIGIFRRKHSSPKKVGVPVISVGNLTVGGSGKTPLVRDLVKRFQSLGKCTATILRGYGGNLRGPLKVNTNTHTASDVGDEALLHADDGATWISANRYLGAVEAIKDGAEVILLDDAHQHFSLEKNFQFLVIDGKKGFGNKHILPSGPLREEIQNGLQRANAAVLIGEDKCYLHKELKERLPIHLAKIKAGKELSDIKNKNVVAFCGIANPERFFDTLHSEGINILKKYTFSDHHKFTHKEIQAIKKESNRLESMVVTTEKDYVRIPKRLRENIKFLSISIDWNDSKQLEKLINQIITQR